jgi:hypothetical protein
MNPKLFFCIIHFITRRIHISVCGTHTFNMNNLPKKMNPASQNMNPHQIPYRIRKNVVFIRFSEQNPPPA